MIARLDPSALTFYRALYRTQTGHRRLTFVAVSPDAAELMARRWALTDTIERVIPLRRAEVRARPQLVLV